MRRWMIIIGGVLVLLVGIIWGFNAFRSHMIAEFFKNNKPPPTVVAVAEAKSEVLPNLLTAVGDLAAINQVNVTTDVNGRVTEILFQPGSEVKAGDPLLQIYDAPEQSDLASFKAQTLAAQLALDRAKTLLAKSFGPQATVDQAQLRSRRPKPSFHRSALPRRLAACSACVWSSLVSISAPEHRSSR